MAREVQQSMSDARLAADVLQRWFISNDPVDVRELQAAVRVAINTLSDNERLRAREAALVEVVRVVAYDDPIQPDSGNFVCYYCCACAPYESAVVHGEHCVYEQARALLASEASGGQS